VCIGKGKVGGVAPQSGKKKKDMARLFGVARAGQRKKSRRTFSTIKKMATISSHRERTVRYKEGSKGEGTIVLFVCRPHRSEEAAGRTPL